MESGNYRARSDLRKFFLSLRVWPSSISQSKSCDPVYALPNFFLSLSPICLKLNTITGVEKESAGQDQDLE